MSRLVFPYSASHLTRLAPFISSLCFYVLAFSPSPSLQRDPTRPLGGHNNNGRGLLRNPTSITGAFLG